MSRPVEASLVLDLSATEAARLIARRELTSVEVVLACLERIDARESAVEAWEYLDPELALAQARARDAELRDLPLWGVPVGIKDVIDTFDMPTAYGSPIYAGHRPGRDATCVGRLRRAGAVLLGKTVTTEFAGSPDPGKTRNPHDPSRTPGGSSSGSAAAVADRMTPIAVGTQAGGSVLRPAGYCGVFGFKPTYGALGRGGIKVVTDTLDHVGVFARTVDDLALQSAVLSGPDADDPATRLPGHVDFDVGEIEFAPTIGLVRTSKWNEAEAASRDAVLTAVECFASAGASIEEVVLPWFDELIEASIVILDVEVSVSLGDEYDTHLALLGPSARSRVERGRAVAPSVYHDALRVAAACRTSFDAVAQSVSCLLTPNTHGEAPSLDTIGDALFNRGWTLLGCPAISVPGLVGPSGLPVGIQLVGRHAADGQLLAAARWAAGLLPAGGR